MHIEELLKAFRDRYWLTDMEDHTDHNVQRSMAIDRYLGFVVLEQSLLDRSRKYPIIISDPLPTLCYVSRSRLSTVL